MGVEVVTSASWSRFANGCRRAGDRTLMREVRKEIRVSSKPAAAAVKAKAPAYMPDRYAGDVAKSLRVAVTANAQGVTLKGRAKTRSGKARELRRLERGVLRHPLWGRWVRGKYMQQVRPGFWSEPLVEQADEIRRGIAQALDRVADRIAG